MMYAMYGFTQFKFLWETDETVLFLEERNQTDSTTINKHVFLNFQQFHIFFIQKEQETKMKDETAPKFLTQMCKMLDKSGFLVGGAVSFLS